MREELSGENTMLMIEYKDVGWWYWLVTVCLLTAGIAGWQYGFDSAIGLTLFQLLHYLIREGSPGAFPVQVRIGYLVLLLIATPESLNWIFWIPMIGTWAQVIFGYCTMARFVSLFPWNRVEPFSLKAILETFLTKPVRGNILQGHAAMEEAIENESIANQ